MIGVSLFSNISVKREFLKKESWHRNIDISISENGNGVSLFATTYDGYPIDLFENDEYLIIIEGCIYNINNETLKKSLFEIASGREFKKLICEFVLHSDGDFIVYIKNKRTGSVLLFNDELGALPFHYYYDSNCLLASRSLSFVAVNTPVLAVSQLNFVEKLTMNYNMFDRTIFKDIKHILPSECLCFENDNGNVTVSRFKTSNNSFQIEDRYQTKEGAINALADLYLEGCKNRCNYSTEHGFAIVNTMSGGFDSRTVLAGIEKYVKDYTNITYEYKQDESIVARKCLNAINSSSLFVKHSFNNQPDYSSPELALKTDGKVTMYITSICYNDLMYSINNNLKGVKVMYFGGFGGEFIRHPLFDNVWNAANIGSSFTPTIKKVARICNVDVNSAKQLISDSFKSKKSGEAFCKEFYSEYYRRYVRNAGEDRDRMFFFTVQPLMSKFFVKAVWNKIPLSWVGFRFHIDFLRKLNPALTTVELFGKVDINSRKSIFWADYKHKGYLINQAKRVYRYFFNSHDDVLPIEEIKRYLNNIPENILNIDALSEDYPSYSWDFKTKLLSLLQFLSQVYYLRQNNIETTPIE